MTVVFDKSYLGPLMLIVFAFLNTGTLFFAIIGIIPLQYHITSGRQSHYSATATGYITTWILPWIGAHSDSDADLWALE